MKPDLIVAIALLLIACVSLPATAIIPIWNLRVHKNHAWISYIAAGLLSAAYIGSTWVLSSGLQLLSGNNRPAWLGWIVLMIGCWILGLPLRELGKRLKQAVFCWLQPKVPGLGEALQQLNQAEGHEQAIQNLLERRGKSLTREETTNLQEDLEKVSKRRRQYQSDVSSEITEHYWNVLSKWWTEYRQGKEQKRLARCEADRTEISAQVTQIRTRVEAYLGDQEVSNDLPLPAEGVGQTREALLIPAPPQPEAQQIHAST